MFLFSVSLLFLAFILFFAKHQKTKNISFISLVFEFVVLVYFFMLIAIQKSKKILLCLLVSFYVCFKIENPKIFVVLLLFCIVVSEFENFRGSTLGLVIISHRSSHTSEKQ